MNSQPPAIDPAITFPYRLVMLLMVAVGALSLAGAGATFAVAKPVIEVAADQARSG